MAELKIMVAANTATLASAKGIFLMLLVVISTAVIGLVVRAAWELWA